MFFLRWWHKRVELRKRGVRPHRIMAETRKELFNVYQHVNICVDMVRITNATMSTGEKETAMDALHAVHVSLLEISKSCSRINELVEVLQKKPFACEKCDRPFATLQGLKRHRKVHGKVYDSAGALVDSAGAPVLGSSVLSKLKMTDAKHDRVSQWLYRTSNAACGGSTEADTKALYEANNRTESDSD